MISFEQYLKNLKVPSGRVDMVLDTDAYNEIDDQFAISYAIRSTEKLNLVGLYAAPFLNSRSVSPKDGMEKSYDEIKKLLKLAGADIPVYRGSENYLPSEKEPVDSPAARALAELAMNYTPERPLYVAAIGAVTNVASAILMKPEITERIVVVWLGGHTLEWHDSREFNMMQDVAAARVIYGCGVPVVMLPCMGVVSAFTTTGPELEYWLHGKGALAEYLLENTVAEVNTYAKGRVWSRVIWDVTAIGWLLNDNERFMLSKLIPAPIPEYDHHYGFDPNRHFVTYVRHINRDALFADLFNKIAK